MKRCSISLSSRSSRRKGRMLPRTWTSGMKDCTAMEKLPVPSDRAMVIASRSSIG